MPPPRNGRGRRQQSDSKLDALLRQGAANKKVDIDRALLSTNDRLLKESIVFTASAEPFNSVDEFLQDQNVIVLDSSKEAAAAASIRAYFKKAGLVEKKKQLKKISKNIVKGPKIHRGRPKKAAKATVTDKS